MKIAVMGAGAVGCYYGGMLARAGHEVALIGRAQHVDAMCRQGLLLETQSFREYIPVSASTEATTVVGAEIVLCCVKSSDTEAAAQAMAPHLGPETLVLSLQNGVDNAARLQALLPQQVAPAVVYVATEMAGAGHVRHHGRGELVLGPAVLTAAQLGGFDQAGIPVRISDNVAGALWAKLILNCAFNAISALTQMPYGVIWQSVGVEECMRDIVGECLAVARAEGVAVPDDVWEAVILIARTMPGQLSSTAQDLSRCKPSEIDHLNGYVVRRGEAHAISVSANRLLHTLVKLLEARQTR
jgi:2-dehydropantoate 2-reductase